MDDIFSRKSQLCITIHPSQRAGGPSNLLWAWFRKCESGMWQPNVTAEWLSGMWQPNVTAECDSKMWQRKDHVSRNWRKNKVVSRCMSHRRRINFNQSPSGWFNIGVEQVTCKYYDESKPSKNWCVHHAKLHRIYATAGHHVETYNLYV